MRLPEFKKIYRKYKVMPRFRDITLYFKSSCCDNTEGQASSPCRKAAPQKRLTIYDYFYNLSSQGVPLYAATITIGNKKYGSMDSANQYKHFKKAIKQYIPFHSQDKYVFTFELQSNGQLHSHGITTSGYLVNYTENFYKFGSRNGNPKSLEPIKSIESYIKYIQKEQVFPTLTNVMKKDLNQLSVGGHSGSG